MAAGVRWSRPTWCSHRKDRSSKFLHHNHAFQASWIFNGPSEIPNVMGADMRCLLMLVRVVASEPHIFVDLLFPHGDQQQCRIINSYLVWSCFVCQLSLCNLSWNNQASGQPGIFNSRKSHELRFNSKHTKFLSFFTPSPSFATYQQKYPLPLHKHTQKKA